MAETAQTSSEVAIVLAPPGSEAAAVRVISAERPWRVAVVSDPMMAIAEIALAVTAATTKAEWALSGQEDITRHEGPPVAQMTARRRKGPSASPVAFILVHPQRWPFRHELVDAIAQYFPATRLFAYDERGLREAEATTKAKGKRGRTSTTAGNRSSAARRQDSGPRPPRPSTTGAAPRTQETPSSVSREEMDMLLGGESR